jgi:zinc finger CCHC domain-containing protein 8
VAKAELTKVRQTRQFQLEAINIQDKGQEKWKRKYVYWIPALHIDGKEVAKGRWDATHVNQALDLWEKEQQQKTDGEV